MDIAYDRCYKIDQGTLTLGPHCSLRPGSFCSSAAKHPVSHSVLFLSVTCLRKRQRQRHREADRQTVNVNNVF